MLGLSVFASELRRSRFLADTIVLSGGTAVAQFISIAALPVLSRFYGPEVFGLFGVFMALSAFVATGASGRYELAIILVEDERDAEALVWLCVGLSGTVALALFGIALFAREAVAAVLGVPDLAPYLLLLPMSVALLALYSALVHWLNRQRLFRRMSANRVLQAALINGTSLVLGFAKFAAAGLVLGHLIGVLATTVSILRFFLDRTRAVAAEAIDRSRLARLARNFRHHPQHLLPSHLIGSAALNIPIVAITFLYGPAAAGFYLLAHRLVSLPTQVVASAIGDVYRQRASFAYRERGEFRGLFLATAAGCATVAAVPAAVLYWAAPALFGFALGLEWVVAGEYAQLLVISAFVQFISTPVDKGALIVGATRYIFVWQVLRLFAFALTFATGYYASLSVEQVLMLFVAANVAVYVLDIIVEYRLSYNSLERTVP